MAEDLVDRMMPGLFALMSAALLVCMMILALGVTDAPGLTDTGLFDEHCCCQSMEDTDG